MPKPQESALAQHQLSLLKAIQSKAPAALSSMYQKDDYVHDVFCDYTSKHPGYLKGLEPLDWELLEKALYHRRFSQNKPKYPVHRTATYDATELELVARNRIVIDDKREVPNYTFELLRDMVDAELLKRKISLPK